MGSNKVKQVKKVNPLHYPRSRKISTGGPVRARPVPVGHPSIIKIRAGEDIKRKILAFSRGQGALGIISGIGSISAANLKIPGSDETVTHEGPLELLSLHGSFTNDGEVGPFGGLTVTLSDAGGRIISGAVEGVLTAGGPVQVIVLPTLVAW